MSRGFVNTGNLQKLTILRYSRPDDLNTFIHQPATRIDFGCCHRHAATRFRRLCCQNSMPAEVPVMLFCGRAIKSGILLFVDRIWISKTAPH